MTTEVNNAACDAAQPVPAANLASSPISSPVPSPCINVCRMEPASGLCEGCLRTLDEIAAWSQFSDVAKGAVWQQLALRRAARPARDAHQAQVSGAAPALGAPTP